MIEMASKKMHWAKDEPAAATLSREWLVTNGLGGYASGTIVGACTRRFHGILVAALPAPLGRTMMLNHLAERVLVGERLVGLGGVERPGGQVDLPGACELSEFRLEAGLPVWRFEADGLVARKAHRHAPISRTRRWCNIAWSKRRRRGVELHLHPSVSFRPHEGLVSAEPTGAYRVISCGRQIEIEGPSTFPALKLTLVDHASAELVLDGGHFWEVVYRVELARGYDHQGVVYAPGSFRAKLGKGQEVTLVASVESWAQVDAMKPNEVFAAERERREKLLAAAAPELRTGETAELVLAADQFVISPTTRLVDATQAHAAGDEARTVIAGYHWFTDWGRDTMISLEGLTLLTGRHVEAGYILRTFARYIRDGLIPNLFPEGEHEGLYHTADATLWFFHALGRYLETSGDEATLEHLLPALIEIIAAHQRGTHFGIGVDPDDGLLRQGAEGYQLTWMDAKVDDWVVTPRRGKAVELNALYYNALKLLEGWLRKANDTARADSIAENAVKTRASFNARFWNEERQCLFDVIDGGIGGKGGIDASVRPNQIFAVSLDHPVLDESRWGAVVDTVERELWTPLGLRTLSRDNPDYKGRYDGDLRARDAAYHQGTVWAWLIGPFVDAWLRVHPGDPDARRFVAGFGAHLTEACIGSISEIFDAEAPYEPRGCVAQAWSVAEVLRAHARLARG